MIDDVKPIVISELERSCSESGSRSRTFADQEKLEDDLGLSSLDVVQLVSRIAGRIPRSPTSSPPSIDLRTVGDLCRAFEDILPSHTSGSTSRGPNALMTSAANRATKRLDLRYRRRSTTRTNPTE